MQANPGERINLSLDLISLPVSFDQNRLSELCLRTQEEYSHEDLAPLDVLKVNRAIIQPNGVEQTYFGLLLTNFLTLVQIVDMNLCLLKHSCVAHRNTEVRRNINDVRVILIRANSIMTIFEPHLIGYLRYFYVCISAYHLVNCKETTLTNKNIVLIKWILSIDMKIRYILSMITVMTEYDERFLLLELSKRIRDGALNSLLENKPI